MRLQKYLADVGQYSRNQVEGLIRKGKITVNGKRATLGDTITGKESIVIDGIKFKKRKPAPKKVIAFNKPKGVECTLIEDPDSKTLVDFDFGPDRVFPIGKLDKEAHGLLLITNDGDLGNKLAQPGGPHAAEYLVVTKEPITEEVLDIFRRKTGHENIKFRTDKLKQLSDNSVKFTLRTGRIKHIKKITDPAGVLFTDIQRTHFGPIDVAGLAVGEWRELTNREIKLLSDEGAEKLSSVKTQQPTREEVKTRPRRRIITGGSWKVPKD